MKAQTKTLHEIPNWLLPHGFNLPVELDELKRQFRAGEISRDEYKNERDEMKLRIIHARECVRAEKICGQRPGKPRRKARAATANGSG